MELIAGFAAKTYFRRIFVSSGGLISKTQLNAAEVVVISCRLDVACFSLGYTF